MTWVRLADDFADHPKVLAAGPLAGWLWVCGLAYCNRYLTDGVVPAGAVRRLVDVDEPARLASRLVEVGLWERVDGGFRVHDYAQYQPTAERVRKEREDAAERMDRWRKRHYAPVTDDVSYAESNGVTSSVSSLSPDPVPVKDPDPDPDRTSPPPPPSPQAEKGERRNPGRRSRGGVVRGEDAATPPPEVTSASPDDRQLWESVRERLRVEMSAPNWDMLVGPLVVLGRTADGALCLRAPPDLGARRVRPAVAKALLDAGDLAAAGVTIVEQP